MTITIYNTGTASVSAGGTTVTGAGVIWTGGNAREGDEFVIGGVRALILEVVSATELTITPWQGGNESGAAYTIYQTSSRRFDDVQIADDLQKQVAALNTDGFYHFVKSSEAAPDPSLGDEGQYAFQATTGKLWLKEGGVWVYVGVFKGVSPKGPWDSGANYAANDIVSSGGSSYLALAANTNDPPPSANWMLIAAKGEPGQDGTDGGQGPIGPPGLANAGIYNPATAYEPTEYVLDNGSTWVCTAATTGNAPPVLPTESNAWWSLLARKGQDGTGTGDVVGPASATDNRLAVFNGTSGKIVKEIGDHPYGPVGKVISNADDITENGTYAGQNISGMPDTGWWVIKHDVAGNSPETHGHQVATKISTNERITRSMTGAVWSAWVPIVGEFLRWDNWIINGDFQINQRGGTRTPGVGVYGYDRWKGHANGLEQIVEALPAGEYTLAWTGGGTGTFAGTTAAAPFKATTAGGNVSVVVPSNANNVCLLRGDATQEANPFVPRHPAQERMLCARYCHVIGGATQEQGSFGYAFSSTQGFYIIYLPTVMRTLPTLSTPNVSDWNVMSINSVAGTASNLASVGSSPRTVGIVATVASGLTSGQPGRLQAANTNARMVFDAEL